MYGGMEILEWVVVGSFLICLVIGVILFIKEVVKSTRKEENENGRRSR